jgi:hypothetical protein
MCFRDGDACRYYDTQETPVWRGKGKKRTRQRIRYQSQVKEVIIKEHQYFEDIKKKKPNRAGLCPVEKVIGLVLIS